MTERTTGSGKDRAREHGRQSSVPSLREEVGRLFDCQLPPVFGQALFEPDQLWAQRPFRIVGDVPCSMDLMDCVDRYELAADLPGMAAPDVAVEIKDGMLRISGQTCIEQTDAEGRVIARSQGLINRSIPLPANADHDAIAAQYDGGVLRVTIPKGPAAKPGAARKITIKQH